MRHRFTGLPHAQARDLLITIGRNTLPEKPRQAAFLIFCRQLKSPLVYILLAAAGITVALGDYLDTSVILLAVGINTILGFFQEYKAEAALFALKKLISPQAKVIRGGEVQICPVEIIVPGDVVILSPGDRIPADGVVIEAVNLLVNESMLTGESVGVKKLSAVAGDQQYAQVFMGTVVTAGRGIVKITQTGMHTRLGTIATTMETTEEEATPLQKQLDALAKLLALLVLTLTTALFILGVFLGEDIASMFATSVAVAVSAIPEGLVVALTVILAFGMKHIAQKKAVVRSLVAAETLGSVTTICVDKTGTLTTGVMKVVAGEFTDRDLAAKAVSLVNNLDDSLEVALWEWVKETTNLDPQTIVEREPRMAEVPFDATKKYMAVGTRADLWVKGAPEVVLNRCQMSGAKRDYWDHILTRYGKKGWRTIAVAHKKMSTRHIEQDIHDLEFLGIFAIVDPVRDGVVQTMKDVTQAGLHVTVVTGDFRETAVSVLAQIGLPITKVATEVMDGFELAKISDEELANVVRGIRLFCRVTPEQKLKIVRALHHVHEVVAMTGDGVNDALALKAADIGIVVDRASDVARETADIVLLDSNFATIISAIMEGRRIFIRVKKVILYLLSNTFTEILLITGAVIFGLPMPLTPTQILWINLMVDTLPSLALTVDHVDHERIRAPRMQGTPLVNARMRFVIGVVSTAIAGISFLVYVLALHEGWSIERARSLTFALVGISTLVTVFSIRSLHMPLSLVDIGKNRWLVASVGVGFLLQLVALYHPWGSRAFQSHALAIVEWGIIAGGSIALVVCIELTKYFHVRTYDRTGGTQG